MTIETKNHGKGVNAFMYYLGRFEHTLDAKGRLFVPARFRDTIGEDFVLFKSPDKCISMYDNESFAVLIEQVRKQSGTAEERRRARVFFDSAVTVTLDKQGRFTVPKDFIEYAGLETDVVIVGGANKLEIWSVEADRERREYEGRLTPDDFPEIIY